MKTIQQDLRSNNLSLDEAITVAQNRPLWRLMSAFGATHPQWCLPHKKRRRFSYFQHHHAVSVRLNFWAAFFFTIRIKTLWGVELITNKFTQTVLGTLQRYHTMCLLYIILLL